MSSYLRPLLPYGLQILTEADIAVEEEVLCTTFLTHGYAVPASQQSVAAKVSTLLGVTLNRVMALLSR
jgi:hypothetical protein